MVWTANISDIRARLRLTMAYNSQGGDISNLDLDYINRAKDWLCQYRPWDFLVNYATLTVPDSRICDLPTDLQSILEVYLDVNGDGKPDLWFYANSPEVMQRYKLIPSYDPATGTTLQIQFPPNAYLSNNPTLKYIFLVNDYTGTGTEISFFPPNLLLRTAQKLYVEDRGIDDTKAAMIIKGQAEDVRFFEQMIQNQNQDMDLTIKNRYGVPVKIYGQPMDGSNIRTGYSPYLPSANFYSSPY